MKKKILVTGGTGRFGSILKGLKTNYEIFFPNKPTWISQTLEVYKNT